MKRKNWRFKLILLILPFALAFPVGIFFALAATDINHTAPGGKYVPGFRIQLDVGIQNSADLLAARCYFKTKQDQNFAFVDLFDQGGGKFKAVLPAPWLNSEAVEYLFVAVDKKKSVARSPLFVLEEGKTKEAAKWKDANQIEEVRLDRAQEAAENCEAVRRQLVKNHGKKLPKFQSVDNADPLMVQTELSKDLVPLNGFYDQAVITEVADSARYGFMAGNLYSAEQIAAAGSSAWWSSPTAMIVGGVAVAGGVVALASGGGGGGGGGTKEICGDGIDNDGDGLIDEGCSTVPEQLTSGTILGNWNVTGSRPDGYAMDGKFNFKDNGVFTYNTTSYYPSGEAYDNPTGDGTWTLNGSYLTLVTNETNGAGFAGTASGNSNAFSLYSPDNEFTLYLVR